MAWLIILHFFIFFTLQVTFIYLFIYFWSGGPRDIFPESVLLKIRTGTSTLSLLCPFSLLVTFSWVLSTSVLFAFCSLFLHLCLSSMLLSVFSVESVLS